MVSLHGLDQFSCTVSCALELYCLTIRFRLNIFGRACLSSYHITIICAGLDCVVMVDFLHFAAEINFPLSE